MVTLCEESLAVKIGERTDYLNAAVTPVGQDASDGIIVFISTGAPSNTVAEDSALGD